MLKFTISFQDLSAAMQEDIWEAVRQDLLDQREIEREDDEGEEAFETRVQEDVDDYINRHNIANEFSL